MNIPDQIKGELVINENAGQGFISNTNDSEKNSQKKLARRKLAKGKTNIDKI